MTMLINLHCITFTGLSVRETINLEKNSIDNTLPVFIVGVRAGSF